MVQKSLNNNGFGSLTDAMLRDMSKSPITDKSTDESTGEDQISKRRNLISRKGQELYEQRDESKASSWVTRANDWLLRPSKEGVKTAIGDVKAKVDAAAYGNALGRMADLGLLKKIYEKMALDHPELKLQIDEVNKQIEAAITKIKGEDKERLEGFDKELADIEDKMLADFQDIDNAKNNMAKFRMLQVLLLLTPVGMAFNLVAPVLGILGPLFDGVGTFGEGLAAVIRDFWIFGDIASFFKLDLVIQVVLDNTPGVAELLALVQEIITAEPTQGLFSLVGPSLVSEPMLLGLVAVAFSAHRGGKEVEHADKVTKTKEESAKLIDEKFKSFKEKLGEGEDSLLACLEISATTRAYASLIKELASSAIAENGAPTALKNNASFTRNFPTGETYPKNPADFLDKFKDIDKGSQAAILEAYCYSKNNTGTSEFLKKAQAEEIIKIAKEEGIEVTRNAQNDTNKMKKIKNDIAGKWRSNQPDFSKILIPSANGIGSQGKGTPLKPRTARQIN